MKSLLIALFPVVAVIGQPEVAPVPTSLRGFPDAERAAYLAYEKSLLATPSRDVLLGWHQMLAAEPHIAGTPEDAMVIASLEAEFKKMGEGLEGWTVEVDEFWAYLARPIAAELEIVGPDKLTLDLREKPVASDPSAAAATGDFAYLAYSGSGEVTGEIVYANYGTKADFAVLKAKGVEVKGKIVLCRYGGNYRGYKVKFAEEAGAAGVLIYTDPADSGFGKGEVYPTGTWSNECCIQRGSLLVTGYQGDPLTPGWPATKDAVRLDPKNVTLPKIPAQPIGYGAAGEIVSRMKGAALPADLSAWVGGVKAEYRLTGGADLKVRMKVEQKREVVRSANVVATLRGRGPAKEEADRAVIIGCHHDAWNCGAADPTCGTITMLAAAEAFTKQAWAGKRPRRTMVFAAWGAEEQGIIGSTEYVEKHREHLLKNGVAYLNLDMASMGTQFGSAASPELKTLIAEVARVVPQARDATKTVFDEWTARTKTAEPQIGDLGGGSDHVAFLMHAGVPSASMSAGGSKGNSYHSAYDTLPWYWKTVGDDYESAIMVSRMTIGTAARLAEAAVIPYDAKRVRREYEGHLRAMLVKELRTPDGKGSSEPNALIATQAFESLLVVRDVPHSIPHLREWNAFDAVVGNLEDMLRSNERLVWGSRRFMRDEGIPGRAWFKNWYVATDENSGYATWVLPGLRKAIEDRDQKALDAAVETYSTIPW